jgi:hypothetical protein
VLPPVASTFAALLCCILLPLLPLIFFLTLVNTYCRKTTFYTAKAIVNLHVLRHLTPEVN